jgi:hypothetical protein
MEILNRPTKNWCEISIEAVSTEERSTVARAIEVRIYRITHLCSKASQETLVYVSTDQSNKKIMEARILETISVETRLNGSKNLRKYWSMLALVYRSKDLWKHD